MAISSGIPVPVVPGGGLIRIVSNQQLVEQEKSAEREAQNRVEDRPMGMLAQHIRARMTDMRNFRNAEGISERLLSALRTYKGMYNTAKLTEIKKFGGSEVYARITATKCRAATALLRDVFLGSERPWSVDATPDPEVPYDINEQIQNLVATEVAVLVATGEEIDDTAIADRVGTLRKSAVRAAKKQAELEADKAQAMMDDMLIEGGFYDAFAEFLIDLPIFPYAVMKGPVVRNATQVKWVNGTAETEYTPKMFWQRVSPFDLYWSPGAGEVKHAEFIERIRVSRAELQSLKGVAGYNDEQIDLVLAQFYNSGLHEWWDTIDTERAELEDRERWARTATTLIDTAEYTGSVSGTLLREWGMSEQDIPDPLVEYHVTAWMIDRFVIKVQITPQPDERPPYFISCFEKIPGALIGYALPDLLEDVQQICNAAVRSLVNNLSIASGPQVIINDEVLQPGEDDSLYPWKRWHVSYDPMVSSASTRPIDFFQPKSNATELLGVYEKWAVMADEISSLPRYMTGSEKVGGAGRTASGLAMLMSNAAKTLQNVAAQIDRDVIHPILHGLFNMIMITQPGVLRGDEQIQVKGTKHAVKREQDRMRQLEFLQLTANPIDMGIIGPEGRSQVLRSVAGNLGLDHEKILPDEMELQDRMAQMAQAEQQQAQTEAAGKGQPSAAQTPAPAQARAGPEQVRQDTGVEGQFTNQATGRPGMRAGG
jgi:hypothetical protein